MEANARQMALERIQQRFGVMLACCLCCFVIPLCLGIAGVSIWAAVTLNEDDGKPCDKPIRTYIWGFIWLMVYNRQTHH